ncbi:MAG: hypothetical protein ACK5JE_12075 [Castellaniella sp.]|uniref:hypothetical protein n=1 Tax=Castellaniella sp. TaxID=1955812 RepID=UPI003A84D17B
MVDRTVIRGSIVLGLAVLVSGCFWGGHPSRGQTSRVDECRWDRSKCLYEGSYEPGERDYAEQEAKELNRAALEKLRRGGIR